MNTRYRAGLLAVVIAASAGLVQAGETTNVFRQGNSTATITQDGDESTATRRVIRRGANSQTIIQNQGGNRARITQGSSKGKAQHSRLSRKGGNVSRVQVLVSMGAEEREELRELALEEDTTVQALVEEAIQEYLDSQ